MMETWEFEMLYAYSIGCKTEEEAEQWLEDNDVEYHCWEKFYIDFDNWVNVAKSLMPFAHLDRSPLTKRLRVGFVSHAEGGYIIQKSLNEKELQIKE